MRLHCTENASKNILDPENTEQIYVKKSYSSGKRKRKLLVNVNRKICGKSHPIFLPLISSLAHTVTFIKI